MTRIVVIFLFFIVSVMPSFSATLVGSVEYTVDIARTEAFAN